MGVCGGLRTALQSVNADTHGVGCLNAFFCDGADSENFIIKSILMNHIIFCCEQ
jgi:hypothetical protein